MWAILMRLHRLARCHESGEIWVHLASVETCIHSGRRIRNAHFHSWGLWVGGLSVHSSVACMWTVENGTFDSSSEIGIILALSHTKIKVYIQPIFNRIDLYKATWVLCLHSLISPHKSHHTHPTCKNYHKNKYHKSHMNNRPWKCRESLTRRTPGHTRLLKGSILKFHDYTETRGVIHMESRNALPVQRDILKAVLLKLLSAAGMATS